MNREQWKELHKTNRRAAYFWYNKVKKILLSKEFESDERTDFNADTIHHLRDTEEQRKYNDEHYEMFGYVIDENGNEQFNYGDYVVFWTQDHHRKYHQCSEETRKKRIASLKKAYENNELREKCSKAHKGIRCKEEARLKISVANKGKQYFGDKNSFYDKHHTEESRKKMSESHKGMMVGENHPFYGKHHTEESRKKMSEALKGKPSAFKGRHHSAESIEVNRKKNIDSRNEVKLIYNIYKNNGGALKWNDFQKAIKSGSLISFEYDFETKKYTPSVEEVKEADLHPTDSPTSDYIPEIEEDDYDYMQ